MQQSAFQEQRQQKQQRPRTASNILYLLLSFPLSIVYFVLIVTGMSVGMGTIIIWVGLPILLLTLVAIRGIAALERDLAVGLLRSEIFYRPRREMQELTLIQRFGTLLRDPVTWKSLVYVLIKFPLSVVSFCLTLPLLIVPIALFLVPLGYVIATAILQAHGIHPTNNVPLWLQPYVVTVTGEFVPGDFAKSFIVTGVGIALWFCFRYIINGLAWVSGELARVFLSTNNYD